MPISARHTHIIGISFAAVLLTWNVSFETIAASAGDGEVRTVAQLQDQHLNANLQGLAPNVWVKLYQPAEADWRRQGHAGSAYDSKRGTLLLFGSNNHGEDWDNSVHEFDPETNRWTTHYPSTGAETYRADANGNRVAGPPEQPMPWALHTFDNVVYDPQLDAIIVTATAAHNPMEAKVKNATIDPTWIYDLSTHRWRIFGNGGKPSPSIFGGASAYDSARDVIVAYGGNGSETVGMFELGPERKQWVEVAPPHHEIHFNMDYDSTHRVLAVFGDWGDSNKVWVYVPGSKPGKPGRWEGRTPGGDKCPPSQTFPVAFDSRAGVFLIVPKGVTCAYDLATDHYTRLPAAKITPLEEPYVMDYDMIYDARHGVFLLVTGEWQEPAIVWALRLDLKALGSGESQ